MAQDAMQLDVGPSPWAFAVPADGLLLVGQWNSLTGFTYDRNGIATRVVAGECAGRPVVPGIVPAYSGDTVTVEYSGVAPMLLFVPAI